jgi:hypothetical protein
MSTTPTQEAGSGTGVVAARCPPTGSWSWPGGERPSWREFRQAALDLDPDRQKAADDLLAAGRW